MIGAVPPISHLRRGAAAVLLGLMCCGRAAAPDPQPSTSSAPAREPTWVSIVIADPTSGDRADESVAEILERTASSVTGVTVVRSEVGDDQVVVSVAFDDDANAASDAFGTALEQARAQLPIGFAPPSVYRHRRDDVDAWVLLRSDHVSAIGLAAVARRTMNALAQQPGVRETWLCGPQARTVLELDPQRMAAYGLGLAEVRALVEADGAAIDPTAAMARVAARAEVMTMREDTTASCSAVTADSGTAVAVHLRYAAEQAGALTTQLANLRATLPPATQLVHEPLTDRVGALPPRVAIRTSDVERLQWREHPRAAGAWMVVRDDGTAELVGLSDASAARELAAALRELPGATAVPEGAPWSSVVLVGMDLERLAGHAPALTEALARVSPDGVWTEQGTGPTRLRTSVDRERAATLGVDRSAIDDALAASSTEGLSLGYRAGVDAQPIVLRIVGEPTSSPVQLDATGGKVLLSSLVTVTTVDGVARSRCNLQRCLGFAIPSEIATTVDLPALGRELGLAPDEYLAVLPRPPRR